MQEKGNLSINSENFMPIIKKWLYTDKDIFIRELVSNACDAVTKLQKLSMMGEADIPAEETYEIHVVLDQDKKTLQIIDNGIGMTADEIKKYINQIAFSGATDFLSKFEGKTEDEGSEIIGHFGLGFYSAFMVADTVEIDSLSYQKGAEPAKWRCNGGIDYEMEAGERTERGTTITLFIGADGEEFLNEATLCGCAEGRNRGGKGSRKESRKHRSCFPRGSRKADHRGCHGFIAGAAGCRRGGKGRGAQAAE